MIEPAPPPRTPAAPGSGPRVLLTGFEPFSGMDHNPSWDLAQQLESTSRDGGLRAQQVHGPMTVHTALLPVQFRTAGERLLEAIAATTPNLVIAMGLAAGTDAVRLERVGVNLRDARIPDNAGHQPSDEPVVPDGPAALFSTLRLKAAHAAISAAGIPVRLSLSAGSFVCNSLLYSLLHAVPASTPAGFVHVPELREAGSPMSLSQAADAVDLLITESLRPLPDLGVPAGELH